MKTEIKKTEDGSNTLYVKDLDEYYHSIFGAITESRHVYIQAGLEAIESEQINVFEMGFGTGLNAFLTLIQARQTGKTVRYTAMELYPLENSVIESLDYGTHFPKGESGFFYLLHQAPWNKLTKICKEFTIEKIHADISKLEVSEQYDLVYFDAFGPDVQPELWTTDIFQKIYKSMRYGSILTTYSSKGQVKQNLREVGFSVKRLPGPPGKFHMTRARKS